MLPDRVSNQGPLTYESGALPIALRGPMSVGIFGSPFRNVMQSLSFTQDCCYDQSTICRDVLI